MYEILGRKINIVITFRDAINIYPKRGLPILNILSDNNAQETLQTVMLNDQKMLDLWYYYLQENNIDEDKALDELTRENFMEFKKEVWEAIVNFSEPQMRGALIEMKKMFNEEITKALQPKNFKKAFLAMQAESESTQVDSASDS